MTFLIDAHLPRRLAHRLRAWGYEVLHTLDLPRGNRTPDSELCDIAIRAQAIVVTKDIDFVDTFTLQRVPQKLLLVSTGSVKMRISERCLSRISRIVPQPLCLMILLRSLGQ